MKAEKEWFESWFDSEYYPLLYNNRDENEAELLVTNLIQYLNIEKGSHILDIACGEGRFAEQLSEHDFDVMGIDLSEQRIVKAKTLERNNLRFSVHDMRHPFYINYFDYAFNFFTSFGYFDTPRDNHMAAHAFGACLKHGGTLVIDYLNTHFVASQLVREEMVRKSGLIFELSRKIEEGKIIKDISFTNYEGKQKHFQERVSAFELHDFVKLFEPEQLELTAHFGDYHLNPFDAHQSPRLIMIFRKR